MNSTPPTSPVTRVSDGSFPSISNNSKDFAYRQPQKHKSNFAYSHLVSPVEEPTAKFSEAFQTDYSSKAPVATSEAHLKNDLDVLFTTPRFYSPENLALMFRLF